VLAVFVDNPKPVYYGGEVAAPIFASIMKRIIQFVPESEQREIPEKQITATTVTVPNLKGLPLVAAEEYLEVKDLDYEIEGEGSHIVSYSNDQDEINLILGNPTLNSKRMPDLRGMSLREALICIDFARFRVRISGEGCVRSQSIKPGAVVNGQNDLELVCRD
jgi:beta-lactam-binding protein with PASTA domain